MENKGRALRKGYTRTCEWTYLNQKSVGYDVVREYCPEAVEANVRILMKNNPVTLKCDDFFQVAYKTKTGEHKFESFRLYNDNEFNQIEGRIPGITIFNSFYGLRD